MTLFATPRRKFLVGTSAVLGLAALGLKPALAQAKLNVVATIPDLAGVVSEVGGDAVSVDAIAKGTQDPHFIEAKPSFMMKVSKADLVVAVGLELEVGWLPTLIQGARNPKVKAGEKGYLEIGPEVERAALEAAGGVRAGWRRAAPKCSWCCPGSRWPPSGSGLPFCFLP